jgi:hypothetical protein
MSNRATESERVLANQFVIERRSLGVQIRVPLLPSTLPRVHVDFSFLLTHFVDSLHVEDKISSLTCRERGVG